MASYNNSITAPETPRALRARVAEGVVFVHSAPKALSQHLDWTVTRVLGEAVHFDWRPQPAEWGTICAELSWQGTASAGAELVTALRAWEQLRFEVAQQPAAGTDGSRWMVTPSLGVYHAHTDTAGGLMVGEDRLHDLLALPGLDAQGLRRELGSLLGLSWDAELEPFRRAAEGYPVVHLTTVGNG